MITPAYATTATERVLPRMALDFTTGLLDPRVSVARAGNTATAVNSSGLIALVNANLPRFDYDPTTLAPRGLLIEEARTNVAYNSADVLLGNWEQALYNGGAVNFYTVSSVSNPSPGPGNASYFIATATPGNIAARQTGVSLPSGSTWTVSAYVYMPTQANVSSWRFDANFQTNYAAGSDIAVFDQWVRVSHTVTLSGASTLVDFNILRTGGANPVQDMYFYMTNMQLEQGAFATSYIPTTTTSVTRNADVVSMTGTNFSDWYNVDAGTWFIQTNARNAGTVLTAGSFTLTANATVLKKYAGTYSTDQSATSLVLGDGTVTNVSYYKQALIAAEIAAITA